MISVIIPTFKEPEALDLCLRSAIEGQHNKNEIIVVVDGYYDINKSVLEKYKSSIEMLDLGKNYGLAKATNLGVYNASNERILIVNDDNVFPYHWDVELDDITLDNRVVSPNQIEPFPSIFKQFKINDLGRDPVTFNLVHYWKYEKGLWKESGDEKSGSTLPIFIKKYDYLKVGGWDECYPNGAVADWDFFLKCSLCGMEMIRAYNLHFYHFVGKATWEKDEKFKQKEMDSHEYAKYKWGTYIKHNPEDNSKYL